MHGQGQNYINFIIIFTHHWQISKYIIILAYSTNFKLDTEKFKVKKSLSGLILQLN